MQPQPYSFKVSVIIPVYNAEKYIERAVESVVNLPEAGEILLINDGSLDNSGLICKDLSKKYNPQVRYFEHPDKQNHGSAASRNLGIKNASFEYISFLDADDYYLCNRFSVHKEIFRKESSVHAVYGAVVAQFENESARQKFQMGNIAEFTTLSKPIEPGELFRTLLLGGYGCFHTSAITIRKKSFDKSGLFNEALRYGEDTDLWFRLSLMAKVVPGSIDKPVAIRWVHDTNSIHEHEKIIPNRDMMYEMLFKWILSKPFSFDVKNSCFNALFRCSYYKEVSQIQLLWEKVKKNPKMLFTTFFYNKLKLQLYKVKEF